MKLPSVLKAPSRKSSGPAVEGRLMHGCRDRTDRCFFARLAIEFRMLQSLPLSGGGVLTFREYGVPEASRSSFSMAGRERANRQ